MCGIAGFYVRNVNSGMDLSQARLEKLVNELALGIESRGKDATGILSVEREGAQLAFMEKANMQASEYLPDRKPLADNPRMALIHTRLATQGPPHQLENNHPVKFETTFVTHNGHISNDKSLFAEEELERTAEVDSQAISALLHKYEFAKAPEALGKLEGGFAIAAWNTRLRETLMLAKGNSSPLCYVCTPDLIVWASTKYAIEDAWKKTICKKIPRKKFWGEMQAGQIAYVTPSGIRETTFKVKERTFIRTTTAATNYQYPYGSSYDWSRYSREKAIALCTCGETQWHHTGPDCFGRVLSSRKVDCEKFIPAEGEWDKVIWPEEKEDKGTNKGLPVGGSEESSFREYQKPVWVANSTGSSEPWIKCMYCEELTPKRQCTQVGSYWICDLCDAEVPDPEGDSCSVNPTSGTSLTTLTEAKDHGGYLDDDDYSYDQCLLAVAKELNEPAWRIEWIIFDAMDWEIDQENLTNLYVVATQRYEELLLESARKAVVSIPTTNTNSDFLPQMTLVQDETDDA